MSIPTLYELLATKLAAIDRDCESAARTEINHLYSQAVYDGARFRAPSFQEATAIWLRLIIRKEKEFCAEIARVLNSRQRQPDDHFFVQTTNLIENYFSEHHFATRLSVFTEAIERRAASYGLKFDVHVHQIDFTAAAYRAGMTNELRQARDNTQAELILFKNNSHSQKERLHIEDIDNFSKVRNLKPSDVSSVLTNGYWDVSEESVQVGLEEILDVSFHKKDWGGEYNDLFTSNLIVNDQRLSAAFMLKGAGLGRKTLEISGCGKNGDQLVRLFESPAQIYIVQFVGEISEAVIKDVEGKVREKRAAGREAWFCAINGQDTARLFRAYGKL